jgi:hypothetical protein
MELKDADSNAVRKSCEYDDSSIGKCNLVSLLKKSIL